MELATAKAVISGGASGLGFATAQRVIGAGGQVVLFDINDEQGASSAASLGDRASYIKTDVSDEDSVKAAVKQAAEAMGGITLAVNCAGIATAGRALGREGPWPSELFNKVIQVNLVGSFNVTKEAAAVMQLNDASDDGERGVIISTASIAAFEGQIGQVSYTAAKGGISAMTLTMARDLGNLGIRCMTIAPSLFTTGLTRRVTAEAAHNMTKDAAFPHRMGEPHEFATMAIAILECAMMNGSTLRVDAGQRFAPR